MKPPASFYAFRNLITETFLGETDPTPSPKRADEVLSFMCDAVLTTLHAHEDLRDAVVDSRVNIDEKAVLLVLNPEIESETIKQLIKIVRDIDVVRQVAYGKREVNGAEIKALKLTGNESK